MPETQPHRISRLATVYTVAIVMTNRSPPIARVTRVTTELPVPRCARWRVAAAIFVFITGCLWLAPPRLHAGLTGENVALIVNASSIDSLTIANHYAALRHIPSHNIIFLDDVPGGLSVSLDAFRDRILKPVLESINSRRIAPQISVIAYSAGFPTSVDITSLTKRLEDNEQEKYRRPTASINSLTFFYRWVLSDSPDCLGWGANLYARGTFDRHFTNPFAGEKGNQFDAAAQASRAERFKEAAEGFETLANEFPTLCPLPILAAENWLRSGDEEKSLTQIRLAIRNGWINRRYLIETEPLSQLFGADVDMPADRRGLLDRLQDVPCAMQGPIAFSAINGWTSDGHAVSQDQGGMPYLLSCMLAVVHEHGSSLQHATASLDRAATSDRTYPDATFGFSKTKDVRSTTRFPVTPDALAWLLARDQKVEIFASTLPTSAKPYIGLMLGAATLPLSGRKWSFAPGAIAENLTSFGAVFQNASQTKLTALLDAGAAISSGTVTEPYALPPKFPTAMTYPYYAEGVTAIEAIYLTVQSPFQLLVVGDPLCQPFARASNDFVRCEAIAATSTHPSSLQITWQPLPDTPVSTATTAMELYLNGKLAGRLRPTPNIQINLPPETHGVVDTRVVLIGDHPTQPRISTRAEIVVGEESQLPQLKQVAADNPDDIAISIDSENAERVDVMHLGRVVGTIQNSSGRITLTSQQIGRGPVHLQAIATQSGRAVLSRSLKIDW